jgi:hypothetical protein
MNRKLLATLLHKNIEELHMITDSFIDLNEYPLAIIHLAKRKTEDIGIILDQLSSIKQDISENTKDVPSEAKINEISVETKLGEKVEEEEILENEPKVEKITVDEPEVVSDIEIESNNQEEEIAICENDTDLIPQNEDVSIELTETFEVTETVEEFETTVASDHNTDSNTVEQHEITTIVEESKIVTIADRISHPTVSRNEVMSKADNSISASIANKKITDIKQAISIGDRFRFQRELFKGNGEEMNKTLNYINQLATHEEVILFLQSKYKWDESNENTADFYQIVKRKFL